MATALAGIMAAAEADFIVHHAKIVTVDDAFSIAEAMAVANGEIIAIGSEVEVLRHKGAATELYAAGGRMVIPGLIDSHVHPTRASMYEWDHHVPEMESIDDVLAYIQARTKVVPEGRWIVVQQVFITRLREERYPTRRELDAVAPRHPVIFRTGPDASVNSLALELNKIDRHYAIPAGISGAVEKDAKGEPTGILRSYGNYFKVGPTGARTPTEADRDEALLALFRDYNANGITSVGDRDAPLAYFERYQRLRDEGRLTVRLHCSHSMSARGSPPEVAERIRAVARHPLHTGRDDRLRIIGIKSYLDGGMLTGSAYMRQPWGVSEIYAITDPAYRGILNIPKERLLPMVRAAVENGLQFTAHAVGDGAVHLLLDCYDELAREGLPVRETRSAITHCNFMSRESVERAARLGVVLDMQPAWLYLDTRTLAKQFGYDRLRYFQPLRSIFAAGGVAGGGSDHMQKIGSLRSVNPYNPFLGMQTAITRRARWHDLPLHPEETLTREQALRLYTINNARVLRHEHRTGSLEVGKLADFAVLDTDVLDCPEERIAATTVLRTYVGGKKVYAQAEP
jgi:hypothetical protein